MKLFNFAVMMIALVLANPASASEVKREANKHKEFSNIFTPASKDFTFKFADLLNNKSAISHDLPSPSSFQFKTESEFDWFGHIGRNSDDREHGHSLIANDDHEGRWNPEYHGDNGHQGGHDWHDDGGYHGGHGDHEWDDDDDFTQPVPEPETYAMLLAGLFAIGALKRRKAAH